MQGNLFRRLCLVEENLSDVRVAQKLAEVPVLKCRTIRLFHFFRVQRMGEEKFKSAFQEIVKQLQEAGLIDGQIQSQDATDMRADIALLNIFC